MLTHWREIRTVLALAGPVALAELGWVAMSVVDTVMVGSLGPVAIGAIAIGSSSFYALAIFGIGMMLGLDTLVAQAWGRGDVADARRSLWAGVCLAGLLTPVLMTVFYLLPLAFEPSGIQAVVAGPATAFLHALSWSTLPLLLYGAFRRFLQATGHARLVTFTLVSANLVNWLGNWFLITGNAGFPALGVTGSALSTVGARCYMAVMLGLAVWAFQRKQTKLNVPRTDWQRMRSLIGIGLPAATQIMLEIGAFGAAAFLAGRLSPAALAAHQVAINVASVTYMVPLGISSAAAVMVGHAIGRGQSSLARHHGWIAIGIAAVFEVCSASVMILVPRSIIGWYTRDVNVLQTGVILLQFAAAFQLFDGLQAVATGALRGLGNTRTAMLVNLCGYWVFGLPVGAILAFRIGSGVYGIWAGLTLALIVIAAILCRQWQQQAAALVNPKAVLVNY